jgi:hypothetical protein
VQREQQMGSQEGYHSPPLLLLQLPPLAVTVPPLSLDGLPLQPPPPHSFGHQSCCS